MTKKRAKVVHVGVGTELDAAKALDLLPKLNSAATKLGIDPSMLIFISTFSATGPDTVSANIDKLLKEQRRRSKKT